MGKIYGVDDRQDEFVIKDPGNRVPLKRKMAEVQMNKAAFIKEFDSGNHDSKTKEALSKMIDECDKRIDYYKKQK